MGSGSDEAAVAVGGLTRRQTLLIGRDHDRRAVLVAAADHQDVVAPQAVIPGGDVRRNAEAGDMPQMPWATRVGPRDGDENALLSTVREGVPPGRARSRTSYGGAPARIGARHGAGDVAGRRRRAPRARGRPRREGPGAAASNASAAPARREPRASSRREDGAGPLRRGAPAVRALASGSRESERERHEHDHGLELADVEHSVLAHQGYEESSPCLPASGPQLAASPRIDPPLGPVPAPRTDGARGVMEPRAARLRAEPQPAPAAVAAPGVAAPAPAGEAEASRDRRSRSGPR